MPRRKPFHRLSRSQVDIRIPGILSDSEGNLDAAGPPLTPGYLKELVAGLYDKKLGDYTGFRMVACQGGGQRLAGVYPGFQIAADGSPDHLVWTGERPRPPEPGTEEGQRRVSFRLLARHLVTRLERLSPDYNCDWTLRMHLHCTVQLQREHEAMQTPAEETLALLRQVCTPQSPGLAIERPDLIEQAGNVHQKGGRGGGVARVKKGATAMVSYLFVLERLFRNEEGGPGVCMRWNITN